MFKRTNNKDSNDISPDLFIENDDYVNSELLWKLDEFEEDEYETYTITKYEHRIDLISKEIYGHEKYSWILLYINRVSLEDLVRHKVLNYIPIDKLTEIINSVWLKQKEY